MKKLYLLAGLSVFTLSAVAQTSNLSVHEPTPQKTKAVKTSPASTEKSGVELDYIYYEDFGGGFPDDWTAVAAPGSPCEWQYTTVGHTGDYPSAPINSTTAANGWMILDSDLCGTGITEDASIISPTIDLSENEFVSLVFEQGFREYQNEQCLIGFSNDNGVSWVEVEINAGVGESLPTPHLVTINASDYIGGAAEAKIRFRWTGAYDYGWQIDDVGLIVALQNDLEVVRTFYTDHLAVYNDEEASLEEYYEVLEYNIFHQTQVRPLTFVAEVNNLGVLEQTDVVLYVTVVTPTGVQEYESAPVNIATGETAFLSIPDVDIFESPADLGEYYVDFQVIQAEEDENEANNTGNTKMFEVSDEIFATDDGIYGGAYDVSNSIMGTSFYFTADMEVTHLAFVLGEGSTPNALTFPNIRFGTMLGGAIEETYTLFEEEEIIYEVEPVDLSAPGSLTWITVELPEPVILEAGNVYSPEILFPGGDNIVLPVSTDQEIYTSYRNELGGETFYLGNNAPMFRFISGETSGLYEASKIEGVKLGQNFPNPAKESTQIHFTLDQQVELSLEVYDMAGRLVMSERLGNLTPGEHQHQINVSSFRSGIYDYSLVDNHGNRMTKSMMIAK